MNILVIAPHSDDELLGCGGVIAKNVFLGNSVFVCIATKGVEPLFAASIVQKTRQELKLAHKYLGIKKTYFLDFPAVSLETVPRFELNGAIQKVVQEIQPDIMFLPHYGDMQMDHRIIFESCMVALRPKYKHVVKTAYTYETLSETEWNIQNTSNIFMPNVYFDISDFLDRKIVALEYYQTQLSDFPNPRSIEAVKSLARFRGSTINTYAAEAFSLIRSIY